MPIAVLQKSLQKWSNGFERYAKKPKHEAN